MIVKNLLLRFTFIVRFSQRIRAGKPVAVLVLAIMFTGILKGNLLFAQPVVENGNGTLVDRGSGLVWQKGDSYHDLKRGLTWYEALEYIDIKNTEQFGGYKDWRLPTLNELNSIWDPRRSITNKDSEPIGLPKGFKEGGSYYLWTADERGLDHAWYFGLGAKENYFNLKELSDLDQSVKMVRNEK